MDPEKQTTFGAIVERKTMSPARTNTNDLVKNIMQDPLHINQTPIKPHLHLSNNTHHVEPPLPSPYSFSDPPNDHPDLEAGLVDRNGTSYPSRHQAPSPMLGEIYDSDHIYQTPPTIKTTLPTPPLPSSTTQTTPPTSSHAPSTAPTITPTSITEKTPAATLTTTNRSNAPPLTMWPTQTDLKAKAKADKRKEASRWNPIMRLSKRNRIIVSCVIALMVVGGAVGVGVGVSRAYHGEVWAGKGKTKPIGENN